MNPNMQIKHIKIDILIECDLSSDRRFGGKGGALPGKEIAAESRGGPVSLQGWPESMGKLVLGSSVSPVLGAASTLSRGGM